MQTVQKLYGLARVLEGAREVYLLFASKRDARSFIEFVKTYILESGAGNGYGAYWYRFAVDPVVGVDGKTGKGSLNIDLIADMAAMICGARKTVPYEYGDAPEYMPEIGVADDAITFKFDKKKLPPRIRPQVGDLARIVCGHAGHRFGNGNMRTREVIRHTAVLGYPYSQKTEAQVDPATVTLPLNCLMKIRDHLKQE